MRYNSADVIEYAVLVFRSQKGTKPSFHDRMRAKFPGITKYALDEALKDARLLLAINKVTMKKDAEEL